MSDHEDGSILSAFSIKYCPNDIAFDSLLDNLVNFIKEDLVSLLLAIRGNFVFRSLNLLFGFII